MTQKGLTQETNYQQLVSKFDLKDHQGTVGCKEQLEYSDLQPEAKEPIILPKEHRFTLLQIEQCHARVLHSRVRSTLAEFRTRFWVPRGRQVVKKVLNQCVVCRKSEGRSFAQPKTASLPGFRVKISPPFSRVGVDFAGHLFEKGKGGHTRKVYIALFTCCITRAAHLELLGDLSVETFKRCLRRFTARRGVPALIVPDNAKTFKGTEKAIGALLRDPQVREDMENQRIEWRFNLERAPWWGGFFEWIIGSVKQCMRKALSNAHLTFGKLLTVLIEVEAILNSRPLAYDYDNPTEEVLTPMHLIYCRRITSLPESQEEEEEREIECGRRHRYLNKKLQHF